MNEDVPLRCLWFTSAKGTIGIAKVKTHAGEIEYRISSVDGFLENMDVLQVVAWGAKFPDKAGVALFGKHK